MENKETTFSVPILFIIFNREDIARKSFEIIRKRRPSKLYIAADGPRKYKVGEDTLCDLTRKVVENIDWPCVVSRKYREENVGTKINMSEAITWLFENEEEGIILEDDCLPDQTFFIFCEELLCTYRNIDKVKMISGNNFQFGKTYGNESYYFSLLPSIWGWATWRRAWKDYDITMKTYPEFKKSKRIQKMLHDTRMQRFMNRLFEKVYTNQMNTWAARWIFTIYDKGGVAVLPRVNLVSNVGFGETATHTKSDTVLDSIKAESIEKIVHPEIISVNEEADRTSFYSIYYRPLHRRIFDKLKVLLKYR